jgi:predicted nucleic acid-binding protein
MKFLDTNVFIRYLTGDDPIKARACFDLFQRVKRGRETVTTTEAIIAEMVYVLSSPTLYHLSHADIRARLVPILSLRGFRLPHKCTFLQALDRCAAHPFLDFEDALTDVHMQRLGITELVSYDTDFDRLPDFRAGSGLKRTEP